MMSELLHAIHNHKDVVFVMMQSVSLRFSASFAAPPWDNSSMLVNLCWWDQMSQCCFKETQLPSDGVTLEQSGQADASLLGCYQNAPGTICLPFWHAVNVLLPGDVMDMHFACTGHRSSRSPCKGIRVCAVLQKSMNFNECIASIHRVPVPATGDPVELGALNVLHDTNDNRLKPGAAAAATEAAGSGPNRVYILAAKSILGHSEPAAGLSGLIYAAQQAAAAAAVPVLHLKDHQPPCHQQH